MPDDLHPTNGSSAARLELFHYLHTTLLKDDIVHNEMGPDALDEVPVLDQLTNSYLCRLRTPLTFDDGTEVTSSDVVFSFKIQVCPEVGNFRTKDNLQMIDDIEIIDSKNFRIVYSRPSVEDLSLWSLYPILQKSIYDSAGVFDKVSFPDLKKAESSDGEIQVWAERFNSNAMGTDLKLIRGLGPYKLMAWTDGEIILKKKEAHWTEKSPEWFHKNYPELLIFRLNSDPNARYLDIKNQVVDVSIGFNSTEIASMQGDTSVTNHYEILTVPMYALAMFTLNLRPDVVNRSPIFTDQLVRQAFAYSLPIEDALNKLSSGNSYRIASPISINKPEYNSSLPPIPFNTQKAKELLFEAGWADENQDGVLDKIIDGQRVDLRVGLTIRPHPLYDAIAKIMIEGLRQSGFDAYIDAQEDWKERLEETHDFDCIFHSLSSSFGPVYPLGIFESSGYPLGINFSGYSNGHIDSLSMLISNTFDFDKRKMLLDEFQQIVYDELPYVYVSTGSRGVLIHKKFEPAQPGGALPVLMLNSLQLKSPHSSD